MGLNARAWQVLLVALMGAASELATAQQAGGQSQPAEPNGPALQEIVVTAGRISQDLQKAPIAVTAVSGKELTERDVTTISRLAQLVPALEVYDGVGPYSYLTIRGVSSLVVNAFGDPAVAVNLDQVYLARTTSFQGLFYDVSRVEVLKGPQGTLYGRNATGGAINVITNAPSFDGLGGGLTVEYGNYSNIMTTGYLNVPLAANVAARAAFQTVNHDGYFDDGTGDQDQQSGRLSFRVRPTSDLSITLRADYTRMGGKGQGATGVNAEGKFLGAPFTSIVTESPALVAGVNCPLFPFPGAPAAPCPPLPRDEFQDNHYWGVAGDVEWSVLGGQLTFIPALRSDHYDYISAAAGFIDGERNDARQTSMEARFTSNTDLPVSYIVGLYYFDGHQSGSAQYDAEANGATSVQQIDTGDRSWAPYGQLTWAVSKTVHLTAGGRYTYEAKDTNSQEWVDSFFFPTRATLVTRPPANDLGITFPTVGGRNWSAVTWKAGVDWDVTDHSLLYANVETGFKSGGFFLNVPGDPRGNTYNPEHITSYSLGTKNLFFDDRLKLNLEVFDYEYKDQQIAALELAQFGPGFLPIFPNQNAGRSRNTGAELESEWLVTPTTLFRSDIEYMNPRYTDLKYISSTPPSGQSACSYVLIPPNAPGPPNFRINCSGQRMLLAPTWAANLGVQQTIRLATAGELVANLSTRFESARQTNLDYIPSTVSGSYWMTNADLTYNSPGRRWSVTAYCNNLADRAVPDDVAPSTNYPVIGTIAAVLQPPRTYGVRGTVRF